MSSRAVGRIQENHQARPPLTVSIYHVRENQFGWSDDHEVAHADGDTDQAISFDVADIGPAHQLFRDFEQHAEALAGSRTKAAINVNPLCRPRASRRRVSPCLSWPEAAIGSSG
jgi:hypothetical protein